MSATGDADSSNNQASAVTAVTGKTCTVIGTFGDDNPLLGTNKADVICGLSGDDRINGKQGNDTIYGNEGNDRLNGLGGDDHLDGGPGTDTVTYALSSSRCGSTWPAQGDRQGADSLVSIENATGSPGDDLLVGSAGRNRLTGGGGADRLSGLGGVDALLGGAGPDVLDGGDGKDSLNGGAGGDTCRPGGGGGGRSPANRGLRASPSRSWPWWSRVAAVLVRRAGPASRGRHRRPHGRRVGCAALDDVTNDVRGQRVGSGPRASRWSIRRTGGGALAERF